jgi:hypothetical protein
LLGYSGFVISNLAVFFMARDENIKVQRSIRAKRVLIPHTFSVGGGVVFLSFSCFGVIVGFSYIDTAQVYAREFPTLVWSLTKQQNIHSAPLLSWHVRFPSCLPSASRVAHSPVSLRCRLQRRCCGPWSL